MDDDKFKNMFVCYKCGYKHYGEKLTHCPRCGTNITMPKFALALFLSILFFILMLICSMFKANLKICADILFVVSIVLIPFTVKEEIKRSSAIKDGFRVPDTTNEILEEKVRVPDLIKLNYIDGLTFSYDIKHILFDVTTEHIILYIDKRKDPLVMTYDEISDIEILTDTELKHSVAKGLISGALLGAALGGVAGVAGYALGGLKTKNIYALKLSVISNNDERALIVGGSKSDVEKLYRQIIDKSNHN